MLDEEDEYVLAAQRTVPLYRSVAEKTHLTQSMSTVTEPYISPQIAKTNATKKIGYWIPLLIIVAQSDFPIRHHMIHLEISQSSVGIWRNIGGARCASGWLGNMNRNWRTCGKRRRGNGMRSQLLPSQAILPLNSLSVSQLGLALANLLSIQVVCIVSNVLLCQ